MANQHAKFFMAAKGVELVAACDIDAARVAAFAEKYGIAHTYTDVGDLLRSPVDAVSIVTPDGTHAGLSLQALSAGKHVLCEKPLATTAADAGRMATAAVASGLIHMVNFSYRNSSAWQTVKDMIPNGELGEIRHFQAHYLQTWLTSQEWGDWQTTPAWLWRLSTAHGSHGALGDLGVHLLDFATGPVGDAAEVSCQLITFDKAPQNQIGEYVLDANDTALIHLRTQNGAAGSLSISRAATGHVNSVALSIHGTQGAVRLDLDRSYDSYEICRVGSEGKTTPWETVSCEATPNNFERFIESIRTGRQDQPDFVRGAVVQSVLEACMDSAMQGRPQELGCL